MMILFLIMVLGVPPPVPMIIRNPRPGARYKVPWRGYADTTQMRADAIRRVEVLIWIERKT
jgi:hypothetical protein